MVNEAICLPDVNVVHSRGIEEHNKKGFTEMHKGLSEIHPMENGQKLQFSPFHWRMSKFWHLKG